MPSYFTLKCLSLLLYVPEISSNVSHFAFKAEEGEPTFDVPSLCETHLLWSQPCYLSVEFPQLMVFLSRTHVR
jgi:hypothetical protein